jgi:MFS family permease
VIPLVSRSCAALRLPRTVWLIGLISLLNDSASEMLYPLIPLYLTTTLMAGPRALGLIEGVAEATAGLLKLLSGVLVDRSRRSRPWIVLGYGLAGLGRPLIGLIASWPMLLLIRFGDRLGKGLRTTPRDAMLAASVDADRRGLAFGVHRAMDNGGAVLGPLLAWWLLSRQVPIRHLFLGAAVPAVVCLLLALRLREPAPMPVVAPVAGDWHLRHLPPAFRRYLLVVALFTLGNSSNMFLLLRAHELGVEQADIPLLWAAVSAVAALASAPLAAWSDRIGRRRVLVGGYLAYGLFYLGLGLFTGSGHGLYALFAGYGLFMAATEGVEKALVADFASPERRGTAFGWFNLTAGGLLLPASALFGTLYQSISPRAAFLFSATCALIAALLLWRWLAPDHGTKG